jgi:hypothetical protein
LGLKPAQIALRLSWQPTAVARGREVLYRCSVGTAIISGAGHQLIAAEALKHLAEISDATGINISFTAIDPFTAMIRFLRSDLTPPAGNNWGGFADPDYDALITRILSEFDPAAQDRLVFRFACQDCRGCAVPVRRT